MAKSTVAAALRWRGLLDALALPSVYTVHEAVLAVEHLRLDAPDLSSELI